MLFLQFMDKIKGKKFLQFAHQEKIIMTKLSKTFKKFLKKKKDQF